MRRLLALLAALSLVAAACGGDDGDDAAVDDPTTTGPTSSTSSTMDGEPQWSSCENPEVAYRVAYPEAWVVNDGEVVPECSLFDPEPFEVPEGTEIPTTIAVSMYAEEAPFDMVVTGGPGFVESQRRETTVDGNTAVRQELVATGQGLHDEGLTVLQWSVDLGDEQTLIAQTHDIPGAEPGFAEAQQVLDRMVNSLRIDLVDDPEPTTTTTAPPDEGLQPVGTPSPQDQQSEDFPGSGAPVSHLVDVRQASHDGFHRIVLEFAGDEPPAYRVSYVDQPVRRPGSGNPVAVEGDARLELRLTPARTVDLSGEEPRITYDGPERIAIDEGIVNELVFVGDFEANMSWVVGVDTPDPFAVAMYEDPTRLVVDIVSEGG